MSPSSHALPTLLWKCWEAQSGHEEAAKLWCKHSALPSESKEEHRQKQTRATSCAGFVSGSGETGSITRPSEAFCQWCSRNIHSAHGLSNMHSAFGAAQGADRNALRAIETPPR